MKPLLVIFFVYFFLILTSYIFPAQKKHKKLSANSVLYGPDDNLTNQRLRQKAFLCHQFVLQSGLSAHYAFLLDMRLPSGKKRFFVYDFHKNRLACSGLVAHGSCTTHFIEKPQFSDTPESGCTALGRYEVAYEYQGKFGKAFKLVGLDSSNENAFKRNIVLHAYDAVPENETYPKPIANSLGCPMVSHRFFDKLSQILKTEKKPVLLWIYQ